MLESPTGTGKTLCLLCASISWQKAEHQLILSQYSTELAKQEELDGMQLSQNSDCTPDFCQTKDKPKIPPPPRPTRIIYTSRTHSQLTQVIKELRHSKFEVPIGLLGARSQLCLHHSVSKLQGTAQNQACMALCSRNGCQFRSKFTGFPYLKDCFIKPDVQNEHPQILQYLAQRKERDSLEPVVWDIGIVHIGKMVLIILKEDLERVGRENALCPYYLSKETLTGGDVLFMPYNYLIDPKIRATLSIDFHDAVVIFDEAHNLVSSLELRFLINKGFFVYRCGFCRLNIL